MGDYADDMNAAMRADEVTQIEALKLRVWELERAIKPFAFTWTYDEFREAADRALKVLGDLPA